MAEPQTAPSTTRDTRLLILTLLLSVAVLALLAQFRFPDRPRPTGVPAATAPSETILKRPISPVVLTWVPPQSSRL